jgi:hypothetical protein
MDKRLTAKEARKMAENSNPAKAVGEILAAIELLASLGERIYKTRNYEFGSGKCYCSEKDYPEICKVILRELRLLGYKCSVKSEERQFVDMWLEVAW